MTAHVEERIRLLLIDDSEIVLAALSSGLTSVGFEVCAVSTLRAFVNALIDWKPHMIVTDLYMPEMSGADLCTWIRKQMPTKKIPIVVCSGAPEKELEEVVRTSGADAFLSKRQELSVLSERIKALCDTIVW